ncbi:MAG: cell division protein ZapA [Desulfovibrionaceae bacterium]|nr:cell division protein ZapA [Desulfovibrionaceae bacterium]
MTTNSSVLKVLGVDIRFKSGVNLERARQAAQLVEDRYTEQKQRSAGGQSKETVILTFLALGLADDLLQAKNKIEALESGMASLLEKIEKSE